MRNKLLWVIPPAALLAAAIIGNVKCQGQDDDEPTGALVQQEGKRLFEQETFGGNGRTCLTCHTRATGTLSPQDVQQRFKTNPYDPLFLHDGSDDGHGHGNTRILRDATILVEIALPPNVTLADDPTARSVVVKRGIPSTLNTPGLDPILMQDGRQSNLLSQANGALHDHSQRTVPPTEPQLIQIAQFQMASRFFSSPGLKRYFRGGPTPQLPEGHTASERRGRHFFEDVPFKGAETSGLCAACHSGPMLNQTNRFSGLPLAAGSRFLTAFVSELNEAKNPVREFNFRNPDGTTTVVKSPDPGRALITGDVRGLPFDNVNAFKIPTLWGVRRTAPYFHDNSAKTLEDVVEHYSKFFEIITDPKNDGDPPVILTAQDKADIVAYLKLLD